MKIKTWLPQLLVFLGIVITVLVVGKLYFHAGFPYTHDGENHLARFANYKIALKEGQFPPRFAPNLMNHYGYPVFNFNYPLANILSVPFSFLKLNYQLTFKVLALAALLSGLLGTWFWQTQLGVKSKWSQLAGLVAAGTSPYLVSLLYFRGNIGELFAWTLLPWLFGLTTKPDSTLSKWQQLLGVGLWAAFFLSHNVTVLYVTPVLLAWILIQQGTLAKRLTHFGIMAVGLASSLWFWLPAIVEKAEVILDNAGLSSGYADHFSTLAELFFSPLQFGFSKVGSIDSLSLGLSLALVMTLGLWLLWLAKNRSVKDKSSSIIFLIVVCLSCVLFQLAITEPLWRLVPLIRFIQFPWRLTLLFSVIAPVLLALYFDLRHRGAQAVLVLLVVIQVVATVKAKPVDYFTKQIIDYDMFSQSTTTANENLPKAFTYESFAASWEPKPTLTSAQGKVTVQSWTGTRRSYSVETTEPTIVIEPTMVFAGWKTTIKDDSSGNRQQMSYINDATIAGRLAFELKPGTYQVETAFTQQTPARLVGNGISLIAIVASLIWTLVPSKKTSKK